ncbi:hypothetical protein ACFX2F_001927 [Malus domestica]
MVVSISKERICSSIWAVARQHNLPPHPILLALASSANIGFAATPIDNPQNLVIAIRSKIYFGTFVIGILPAMLVVVCVNALILLCMFWRLWSIQLRNLFRRGCKFSSVFPRHIVHRNRVSYSLLIFFCVMFITVKGFNKTGIPSDLWDFMALHAQIDRATGIVLAVTILVLSNLASNVPNVLSLGGRMAASAALISAAEEKKAWLLLAWVSTAARNHLAFG